MKVLAIYTNTFSYQPAEKNLHEVAYVFEGTSFIDAVIAFIQIEASDEQHDVQSRAKKLVNHLKWVCRKNQTLRIVLHSFAHLSDSRASVNFSRQLFDAAEERLKNAGYETAQTPFGYFLDLKIEAPGYSLARIWAEL